MKSEGIKKDYGRKMTFFLIGILLTAVVAAAGQALINVQAPDFSLSDQNGQQYSLATFAGRPIVLLASDKKGEEQNHQWGERIGKKYGSRVRTVGVADVRTVPFFLKGRITNNFKKDKNAILLDWDGILFTSYGLAKGVPNVVLIDGGGMVRYIYCGSAAPGAVNDLFREIDRALE